VNQYQFLARKYDAVLKWHASAGDSGRCVAYRIDMKPLVRALKSVVWTSNDPEATAKFYREVLNVPLELERHRGVAEHWAAQVGDLHFAVHNTKGFWLGEGTGAGSGTYVSFTIDDIPAFLHHLAKHGVKVEAQNTIGPMKFVAIRDPDGRLVGCGTPWPGASR
jgi:catechol 2,3-dioxygenase-like lactoylglutathione lyase family enzyme